MIAESALCIVQDCEDSKGVYTPAPAMGEKLERLVANAGLTFIWAPD